MSLSNEQLLLLDALTCYEELSDKTLYGEEKLSYSDEELRMDKII